MKKTVLVSFLLLCFALPAEAARWSAVSGSLEEPDVRHVAADPKAPERLFAAGPKAVYASTDGGARWKRILSVGAGSSRVRFLKAEPGALYVGSDRGVQRSIDGGKRWEYVFRPSGDKPNAALDLAGDPSDSAALWIATENGLFRFDGRSGETRRSGAFGRTPVYSLLSRAGVLFAATADGIQKSVDRGETWKPVYAAIAETASSFPGTGLEQFDVEEMTPVRLVPFSALAYFAPENAVFAASRQRLLKGEASSESWSVASSSPAPDDVTGLVASSASVYAATPKGLFRWDGSRFDAVSEGLGTLDVRALAYHPGGDYLLAATSQGVYKMPHPELVADVAPKEAPQASRDVLRLFDAEPTIAEIQSAAIRYAEVSPEKIENWRRAAARKALLPTFSLGADVSRDRNVDVDRGGTGDEDRFIMGPEEKSTDWSVGFSWDLGDIVWNDDQTSIDTRSRLMVELRDDVLNDVTHLYYERRRLQIEDALAPVADLPVRLERELKLQELTARIDALTGGHLSRRLAALDEGASGR